MFYYNGKALRVGRYSTLCVYFVYVCGTCRMRHGSRRTVRTTTTARRSKYNSKILSQVVPCRTLRSANLTRKMNISHRTRGICTSQFYQSPLPLMGQWNPWEWRKRLEHSVDFQSTSIGAASKISLPVELRKLLESLPLPSRLRDMTLSISLIHTMVAWRCALFACSNIRTSLDTVTTTFLRERFRCTTGKTA